MERRRAGSSQRIEIMKRVLFILYYFPPAGGAGVQRGLKQLRYLPAFGWQPVVLTVPRDASYPVRDPQLAAELPEGLVIRRTRCPEPYSIYRKITGHGADSDLDLASQSAGERGWRRRLARALRATIFIPDGRIGWLPFGIRAGRNLIREQGCECIFSSGPPFTCHLIARRLARVTGLPWVADYRDPWTQATYYPERPALARALDRRLERSCVRAAARTITVGEGMARQLRRSCPDVAPERIVVIPNGYDPEAFASIPYDPPAALQITHSGSLFYNRIPHAFFEAVAEILAEDPAARHDLRLQFAGRLDPGVTALLERDPWRSITSLEGYLPHREHLRLLRRSRVLLLLIGTDAQSKTMVTCKVYEYLAAGVPILGVGPVDGDAAAVLRETGRGWIFAHQDRAGLKAKLKALLAEHRRQPGRNPPSQFDLSADPRAIARYSRREQAAALARLLDQVQPTRSGAS
jgi:glycosyltransferase involved in cell wall biosynthesis